MRPQPEDMLLWLREAFDGRKVQALPAEAEVVLLAPFQRKLEDEVVLFNIRLPPPTAKALPISGDGVRWVAAGAQERPVLPALLQRAASLKGLASKSPCALLQTLPRPC